MEKQIAIQLLGGSVSKAAKAVGVTYWAVYKWPDVLSPRIADRVEAAIARTNIKRPYNDRMLPGALNQLIVSTACAEKQA